MTKQLRMAFADGDGLPPGWVAVTMGQVTAVSGGLTKNSKRTELAMRMPYLRVANVYANALELDDIKEIGINRGELDRVLLRDGDLLVVEGNGSIDHIGRVAQWTGEIEPCVHQNHLIKARPPTPDIGKWLLFWLLSPAGRTAIIRTASSTSGLHTLSLSKVRSLPVRLAPVAEQRRIVAEIETQFTRLDAAVSTLERVQANLKRARASVLKAAVEGRLVPTEADLARAEGRSYEPASALLDRILEERRRKHVEAQVGATRKKAYKPPVDPAMDGLPELPEGWAWARWESLCERVTVGYVGPMAKEYRDEGVPFLRGMNVRANRFRPEGLLRISPEFHEKISKSRIFPGDLLVVRSGAVGTTCVLPNSVGEANCSDLVLIQRPSIEPNYGAYYMNSNAKRQVEEGKVGIALTHFNTKSVAALPVPVPPLAEQVRIVAEVERRLSILDALDQTAEQNLARCKALRQSILKRAFEGKLVPQEPADEPASELLARIQAQTA